MKKLFLLVLIVCLGMLGVSPAQAEDEKGCLFEAEIGALLDVESSGDKNCSLAGQGAYCGCKYHCFFQGEPPYVVDDFSFPLNDCNPGAWAGSHHCVVIGQLKEVTSGQRPPRRR